MSKRKFDYEEFYDEYGVLFDADKYTKEQAIEIYKEEFDYKFSDINDISDEFIQVEEDYVRWKPKMSKEDMWYFDIYDNRDNHGIYQTCNKDDKKAFKCWRLTCWG